MADDFKSFHDSIAGKNDQIYDYLPATNTVGDFRKIEGINVLINSIRTLLLTPLGFYPFDPLFGSLLYKKVFDPLDEQSRQEIEFEVYDRVLQFDDRIEIDSVEVFAVGTNGKAFQVEVYINRGDIKGKVSVHLPGPSHQFAFEDE